MDFEWDTAKADANLAKHGVDFGGARQVFDDPDVLITAIHECTVRRDFGRPER